MDRRKLSLKQNRQKVFATVSLALTVLLPLGHSRCRKGPAGSAQQHTLAQCSPDIPPTAPLQDNSHNTLLSGLPKLAASSAEGRAWFPFPLSQHLVEH